MVDKAANCIDIDGDSVLCPICGYPSTLLLWPAPLKLKASIAVESNPSLNSMGCLNRCSDGKYRMEQRVLISEEENTVKIMMKNAMT
eukprot:scaffold19486_cov171-Skeletonema_marinoi.AAC.1